MYAHVWGWAGQFRKTDKNIGIDKRQIPQALRTLNDDPQFWIENKVFPPDEIAIRYKHGIVSIHCFPNGNGRHSRLMADVIIEKILGKALFRKRGFLPTVLLLAAGMALTGLLSFHRNFNAQPASNPEKAEVNYQKYFPRKTSRLTTAPPWHTL